MATITTYLLVSNPSDVDEVHDHSIISEYDFQHRDTFTASHDRVPVIRFVVETSIEERFEVDEPMRTLSRDFPGSTVVVCEIEERFDHIERLQTRVFMEGKEAGNVEHGYIFNVGGG